MSTSPLHRLPAVHLDELIDGLNHVDGNQYADRRLDLLVYQAFVPDEWVMLDSGTIASSNPEAPTSGRPPTFGPLSAFPRDGWENYGAVADWLGIPRLTASADAVFALITKMHPQMPAEWRNLAHRAIEEGFHLQVEFFPRYLLIALIESWG